MTTATADYPNVIIEWSPSTGPDDTPSWVDISQYVTTGSTRRGKQYEIDRVAAGEMSLELRSTTRLFDPENAAGTYFGQLLPMKQIRVTAVWNSITYPVFYGFVSDWGSTQPDDKMWVTTLTAKDAFERFDQYQLPSSAWALTVAQDNPTAWFRLGETQTTRLSDTSPNGNYGVFDNAQQGVQGLVPNDSDGAVGFAHSFEERVKIQNPSLITARPFTVSMMFKIDGSEPAGSKTMLSAFSTGSPTSINDPAISVFMLASSVGTPGTIAVSVFDGTTNNGTTTISRYDDNATHHLVSVFDSTTTTIYVDNVIDGQRHHTSLATFPSSAPLGWTIGNAADLVAGDFGFGANADGLGVASQDVHRGTIDEVCFWNGTALSPTRIAAQYAAAFGWANDTTGVRLGRFLDAIAWPSAARNIETGISVLQPADWSVGSTALSVMQNWSDTEFGLFFMSADNKVTFNSRHSPLLDTASMVSQATFSDNANPRYQFVDLPRDAALIRNPVTAGRRNGVTVTVSNTTSVAKYGPRNWAAPDSEDALDSSVYDRANWLLARFKELGTRLASMTLRPRTDPTNLWPQALGRVIGDRITVKRTPLGLNSETSLDFIIEGIEHSFGIGPDWTTVVHGAPVDPNVGNYLILDDASHGLLDTNILAY